MKYLKYIALLVVCLTVITLSIVNAPRQEVGASMNGLDGYFATTTCATGCANFLSANTVLIKSGGQTMLGSVIVTGSNSGIIDLYDATTSDVNLRTSNLATSSIRIANFPTNTATGTYVFDTVVKRGLLYVGSGTVATSTITWK